MIANIVNNDRDINQYYKIIFLPDYKVSAAQIIIPASGISQHISTVGIGLRLTNFGPIIKATNDMIKAENDKLKYNVLYILTDE